MSDIATSFFSSLFIPFIVKFFNQHIPEDYTHTFFGKIVITAKIVKFAVSGLVASLIGILLCVITNQFDTQNLQSTISLVFTFSQVFYQVFKDKFAL